MLRREFLAELFEPISRRNRGTLQMPDSQGKSQSVVAWVRLTLEAPLWPACVKQFGSLPLFQSGSSLHLMAIHFAFRIGKQCTKPNSSIDTNHLNGNKDGPDNDILGETSLYSNFVEPFIDEIKSAYQCSSLYESSERCETSRL